MFQKTACALGEFWHALARRSVLIPLIGAITVICMTVSVTAINTFIVYDSDNVSVYNSLSKDYAKALEKLNVQLGDMDTVDVSEASAAGVTKIHINRAFDINVTADGKTQTMRVNKNETVGQILSRAGVKVGTQDIVTPAVSECVAEGSDISVSRYVSYKAEQIVDVKYVKEVQKTAQLDRGTSKVIQKGSNGQKKQVYQVIVKDGVETRTLLREEVLKEATPQIVQVGTRTGVSGPGSVAVSRGGAPVRYKQAITVTATAYTTERQRRKTTATGARARVGLIAVDPKVIPLGSRLYITSADGKSWVYGTAVAADTGGAIKGNRIDLFFDTHRECINFGRRKAIVYVLE